MDSKIVQQNDILQDDLLIEKHGNGKFEGFRFYVNKNNSDQSTNTQNSIENEDLILAFSKRASRLCACANKDFTISSDGIVRWIGQPVGRLIATEDFLKPKLIVLADTQLTTESRDNVAKRLERFVTFHFETALQPLFALRNGDNLTDATSDFASKLVNSLGILPRRKVAETVKNLDQASRAVLRRLGVRFGAFYIYVSGVLKPIPVQAITLLWNLQNEGHDQTGLDEIFSALSAGRTSLAVEPSYNRQFYQLAGYRILGQRAVRVDILERLANLIRPALHWTKGNTPKPDGAYDGKSFFITSAMMSILGAREADTEEILRKLGYQSQSISKAIFEQNLLASKVSSHSCQATQNVPEAECVGDQWKTVETVATTQETKNTLSTFHKIQSKSVDDLPAAEAIGDFAQQKHIVEDDNVVLLWHYNPQPRYNTPKKHTSKKRDKSEQEWQNKPKKTFKKRERANAFSSQEKTSHTKYPYKPSTKDVKRKSFQKEKRPDLDSPFAKLAALREQLIAKKEVYPTASKDH
ncbi:ATP-dependent RNA helicase SUPV3L1/SUV3 [Bartonella silvatica]|uniref:ATP-dependent RNA helicase SUPV3L1/SUV3 n=1 Tax=Bartonella silvatica TaxID=357760 RepID=A0ABV2HGB4_9HYPH